MSESGPTFGEQSAGVTYRDRPGAYGVILDGQARVLVVRGRWGCYLPGGGLEADESLISGLTRELQEELGAEIKACEFLCEGSQYCGPFSDGTAFIKREAFFLVSLTAQPAEAPTKNHQPDWLTINDALTSLTEECQRWAVKQSLPLS